MGVIVRRGVAAAERVDAVDGAGEDARIVGTWLEFGAEGCLGDGGGRGMVRDREGVLWGVEAAELVTDMVVVPV